MMDIRYITLNCEMAPFTDVRVRRAMNHAINRPRIVSFLAGRGTLANGVLPPQMPGFNPQLKGYDYNPDKARALLKEAGLEGKFPRLEMWYSTNEPWYEKAAQSIQADLKKVGADISIRGVRYAELKAKAGGRKGIEMAMMGWLMDYTDPANFFDPLLNGRSITQTSSLNRAFYSNPQVNKTLDAALSERDRAKRMAMYREVEKQIVADAPWVFLHHTERYAAQQPWVEGFKLHPMWSQRLEYLSSK
jgi:ABC-type transport system substrate-binding protein